MKKLVFLLCVTTAQAADMMPVRVVHVQARSATSLQRAEGIGFVVEAEGLVGSAGWTDATLVPRNDGNHAEDGYLEFDLKAVPPGNAAGVVLSIEASIPIKKYDPTKLRGVRVYGGGLIVEHKLSPVKGT